MSQDDAASYGRMWASDYDRVFEKRNNLQQVTQFLLERAGQGPVIEFGIGTGRMSLGLAEAGLEVYGLEASQEMLDILVTKPFGDKIKTILGDFCTTKIDQTFSLVYLTCSSLFMVNSQAAQVACIQNAAHHLTPDGTLVLECFVPDTARWVRGQTSYVSELTDDMVNFLVAVHDPVHQRIRNQHVFLRNGSIELKPIQLRYAWPSEIDLMAQLAGLHRVERYTDYGQSPFEATSNYHVSVYRF